MTEEEKKKLEEAKKAEQQEAEDPPTPEEETASEGGEKGQVDKEDPEVTVVDLKKEVDGLKEGVANLGSEVTAIKDLMNSIVEEGEEEPKVGEPVGTEQQETEEEEEKKEKKKEEEEQHGTFAKHSKEFSALKKSHEELKAQFSKFLKAGVKRTAQSGTLTGDTSIKDEAKKFLDRHA